jgi:dihydroorotase
VNGEFSEKDILLDNGVISAIGNDLKGDERIEAKGFLVLPGLIDPHVHFRDPGDTYKEDFVTGGRTAIAGGFTTVIDMPNNSKPTITKRRLDEKTRLAKKALCDVLFHFGGTDDNFDEIGKANPNSLKLYLGKTTGKLMLKDPESLKHHMEHFPRERPIVLHACSHEEDEEINLQKTYSILENAISLAERLNRRIHIAHCSTKKELTMTYESPNATSEVAPHHLFLSHKDYERLGVLSTVYPPLKSEQRRLMLMSALELADCIATDHAPHTIEDKDNGAAGFPGLETSLALMLEATTKGFVGKTWVVQRMSENPARLFHIEKKGKIKPGYHADITIVDPNKEWKVDAQKLQSKCKWTPFDGRKLKGKVHTVIKDSKIVYQEYKFL